MAAVAQAELRLQVAHFQSSLKKALAEVKRFSDRAERLSKKGLKRGMSSGAREGAASARRLIMGVLTGAAMYKVGQMGASAFSSGFRAAVEDERLNLSFGTFLGSQNKGTAMVKELRKQSLATGVELESITGIMRKLMAMDFSGSDALNLQKNILDVAGLSGMGSRDTALFGVALAQVAAKGVANMEELRQQIAEKGVPIFEALTAKLKVTKGVLFDMIKQGQVSSETVLDIFRNLEGPMAKFRGGAEKLAKTTGGIIARVRLEFIDLMRVMMEPVREKITPFLEMLRRTLAGAKDWGKGIGEKLGEGLRKVISTLVALWKLNWMTLAETITAPIRMKIKQMLNYAARTLIATAKTAASYLGDVVQWFKNAFVSIASGDRFKVIFHAWVALARKFVSILLSGAAQAASSLGFLGLGSKQVGRLSDASMSQNVASKKSAQEALRAQLRVNNTMEEGINEDSIGRRFANNFLNQKNLFSTKSEETLLKNLSTRASAIYAEAVTLLKGEKGTVDGKGVSGMGVGGGGGGGGSAVSGRLAGAINTIMGRSAFNVVADEAKKQTSIQKDQLEQQKKTNEFLKKMAQKNINKDDVAKANVQAQMMGAMFTAVV